MSRPHGSTSHPASGSSTPSTGHALPARPPAAHGSGMAFKPRNVTSSTNAQKQAGANQSQAASYSQNPYNLSHQSYANAPPGYNGYAQGYQNQQQYYGDYSQYSQPQSSMHNPFPLPAADGDSSTAYSNPDAEYQAQMQQWQANYGNVGDGKTQNSSAGGSGQAKSQGNANNLPLKFNRLDGSTPTPAAVSTPPVTDPTKTVVRAGGGQKWEDPTLLEWGNAHRLFIGNLAGEVTDESLLKAFAKYPSIEKARVVRDKRTTKSKGFGFVSFTDADEYFQAAKDMQGKYIGSHPVLIRRAETEIKVSNKKEHGKGKKGGYNQKAKEGGGGNGGAGGKEGRDKSVLGPQAGQGVNKKSGKVETKYKVLG